MRRRRHRRIQEYGLTAGTLGSTAGQTIMVVLLPVLLDPYTDSAVAIGFVIGGEGAFAILVPYWIGWLSDHLPARLARRFGRRTLFLLLTAPILAVALAVVPFLHGYWLLAAAAFVFFAAFHGYLTPLWALMVDAVPDERRGRVHGVRGGLHAAGLGYGLVGGGLLFALWPALPFLMAAVLLIVTTALTIAATPGPARAGTATGAAHTETEDEQVRKIWQEALRERPVRRFLIANALWTGAVDGIRPYIFLFAALVVGISVAETSLTLLLLVAGIGFGSVILGHLGDRFGRAALLSAGAVVTSVAMSLGVFVRDIPGAVVLLLGAGFGAAALIALPYPLFTSIVGDRAIGRYTGLYILSLGFARVAAPMVVGAAIDVGRPLFPAYDGYPLMWPVAGLLALLGALTLRFTPGAYRPRIASRTDGR